MTVTTQDLEKELKLEQELDYHRTQNPAQYYTPNLKIQQFIEVVGVQHKDKLVFLLFGGNSCGKTSGGTNMITNIVYGPQTKYFDYPLFKDWKFPKEGRIIGTSANVEGNPEKGQVGAIQVELNAWLPKNRYKSDKMGKNYSSLYKTDTGFSINIMTYNQAVEEFAGPSLGFIWFDEPPPKGIFFENLQRLRKGGIIFVTMTALDQAWWIFQELEAGSNWYQHPYIDTEDNCKVHGMNGFLEHKHIEKIFDAIRDPDEKEARRSGKPLYFTGRKYKSYDPEFHLITRKEMYEIWPGIDKYPMVLACDPHDRRPFVFVWAKVTPRGDLVFWWEYPNYLSHNVLYPMIKDSRLAIRDYAKIIHDFELGRKDVMRVIDARYICERVRMDDKKTIVEDFKEFHLEFEKGQTDVKFRANAINDYFLNRPGKNCPEGSRRVWILSDLKNLEWSFRNHVWDEWKGKDKDEKDAKQEVRNTPAKCFCNCAEYICSVHPEYKNLAESYISAEEDMLTDSVGRVHAMKNGGYGYRRR